MQPTQQPPQTPYTPQPTYETKGQQAVRLANRPSDYGVLAITFLIFIVIASIYFIVDSFTVLHEEVAEPTLLDYVGMLLGGSIGGVILLAILLGLGMFMVRMHRQTVLGNSLQVEYSSYAWLRDWVNEVAADLQMPRVEVFVTQDPVMNAYALGFARPYIIVLNSGSIRYLAKEELKAIILHEMGHIKYKHTDAMVYLQPFLIIPVLSIAAAWIAGFWNRRCELTCDRLALMYLRDSELVKRALIKIHVGPDVAESMNETARQWLQHNAERPMNRFAQTFSSHPFLVRRLSHIDRYKSVVEPPLQPQTSPQSTAPAQ